MLGKVVLHTSRYKFLYLIIAVGLVFGGSLFKKFGGKYFNKKDEVVVTGGVLLNKNDIILIKSMDLTDEASFTGDLVAKEKTVISSEVNATVVKVLVREGSIVNKGQTLAILDGRDLTQELIKQKSQLLSAKAKLELKQQNLEQQKQLFKEGFVAQIKYNEADTEYKSAQEAYNMEASELKNREKRLNSAKILAPFSGVVYKVSTDVGKYVSPNTELFSIANLSKMEIRAAISSDVINNINLGQEVIFKVEADDKPYNGRLARINQVAQDGTRSYMVYIDFDNKEFNLKSGQFVRGEIVTRKITNQMALPCGAIRKNDKSNYLLILNQDKIIDKPVNIVLRNERLNLCAISGANATDKVLNGSVTNLKSGDKVRVIE